MAKSKKANTFKTPPRYWSGELFNIWTYPFLNVKWFLTFEIKLFLWHFTKKIKIVLTLFKIKLNFFIFREWFLLSKDTGNFSFLQHPFSKIKAFDFYFFAHFLIFSTTSILSISLTLLEIRGTFHQKPTKPLKKLRHTHSLSLPNKNSVT